MAKKNNLKPKAYATNNIDRWSHLSGHELDSLNDYTRDQLRGIASRYEIKNASRMSAEQVIEAIENSQGYKESAEKQAPRKITLFETIRDQTNGESQTPLWYRQQLAKLSTKIKAFPARMTIEQKMDSVQNIVHQDENEMRRTVFPGHMYFYSYHAISNIPYYDRLPMVYVLKRASDHFYGINFHYLDYKHRAIAIKKLENGVIDVPLHILHKYLIRECKGLFLDLATYEWETAAMLPVDDFVLKLKNGKEYAYDNELVWEETNTKTKRLKASVKRIN
jgi:hypothetical protein